VLERQLGGDASLEETVGRAQPFERGISPVLVTEHADVNAGMA
jgi:hypothetical protein